MLEGAGIPAGQTVEAAPSDASESGLHCSTHRLFGQLSGAARVQVADAQRTALTEVHRALMS